MNQTRQAQAGRVRRGRGRLFYLLAGVLFASLTVIGFGAFYARGMAYPDRPIPPPIRTLVIAHGVAMSAWVVLVILQPLLIVGRKRRVHMAVGRVGVVLAAAIVVLGLWLAVRSAAVTPPEALIWGVHPKQFMAVPFIAVLLFAGFVAAGVAYRRKPDVHRTMMVLATLSVLSAPISRIDLLNDLYVGTVWDRLLGPFFATMLFALLLVGVRWAVTRSLDRVLALGVGALLAVSLGIWQLAPTAAWNQVASLFVP